MKGYKLRKHTNIIELRTHPEEIRVANDGRTVSGYAAMWQQPSMDMGFTEYLAPNCFRDSLATGDGVRLLREHDPKLLLARTSSGTLTLKEDATGLAFTATLPKSPIGLDTAELLNRRDLTGMSFSFRAIQDTWGKSGSTVTRTLHKCALSEISIVSNPAYPSTSVNIRSCPAELRSLLDMDSDDMDDDAAGTCNCDCVGCLGGDCSDCCDPDCDDGDCDGCPMQDPEDRSIAVEPEDIGRFMRLQLALRK